jgi:hypothetical protein
MNTEDEEFNRIEREAAMRRKAVSAALKDHIEHMRANMTEYERGVIDGRQMQMKSSVDKAVNAMAQRKWVGLTDKEFEDIIMSAPNATVPVLLWQLIQDKLKEKNT